MLFNKNKTHISTEEIENNLQLLRDKKEQLQEQIRKYDQLENFERGNLLCAKELYGCLYFRYLPLSFIDTAFYTRSADLYPFINCTFESYYFQQIVDQLKNTKCNSTILSFAMQCATAYQSEEGIILILSDPYRTIKTKPLRKTQFAEAHKWIGRIVIADITITPNAKTDNEFELKSIKILKMTNKEPISYEKEKLPTRKNNIKQFTDDYTFREIPNEKRFLQPFKDSEGENACMHAMQAFQDYVNSKSLLFYRENKHTLWLRLDFERFGLFFRNNRLEFLYQPSVNIREHILSDGSRNPNYDMICRVFDSVWHSNNERNITSLKEQHEKDVFDECVINNFLYEPLARSKRII